VQLLRATMISPSDIEGIGRCLSNRLDGSAIGAKSLAGVIGDSASLYSKSPRLWNAAFHHLQINAVYLPFDVDDAHLGDLLSALRRCEKFLGVNVTVPHKVRVMDFLDSIDAGARRIQAVNTIVKTPDEKLVGYNTDGAGFIDSIQTRQPDRAESFTPSLKGMNVLLLGAGGSARAVAFHAADQLAGGKLLLCNRTAEPARSLAAEIQKAGCDANAISEEELLSWAPRAGLIVNCTTKGQGGMRKLPNRTATFLEPYSALAPAHPPMFAISEIDQPDFERRWSEAADKDIQSNHQASMNLAVTIPSRVGFYDLIYHPEATVFLRHGESTGHPTMNGKAMIINQAMIAFCKRICHIELQTRHLDTPEICNEILQVMYRAW
jgi:shikimate dehydrogenase